MKNNQKMRELLVEKYRPKKLEDVVGCPEGLIEIIKSGNIPHLLFEGQQGSGKSTISRIIINKLNADVLSLNASKDRGIDVVRDIIEPFARKKSDRIKIVWLDEMDATTPAMQTSLRNFMEIYSSSTRFIGTCNYINKIIKPIQSRFSIYSFGNYDKNEIIKRLKYISKQENIEVDNEVLELLSKKYKDDIRSMINFLDKHRYEKISIKSIGNLLGGNYATTILRRLLKEDWYNLRQEYVNKNLDYEELLVDIDKIVFSSKLDNVIKQQVNIIVAKGLYEMYFSLNKEICFSSTLAKLQEVFKKR